LADNHPHTARLAVTVASPLAYLSSCGLDSG